MLAQLDISQIEDMVDVTEVSPWDPFWAVVSLVVGVVVGRLARAAIRRYGRRASLAPNVIDLLGTIGLWTIFALSVLVALSFVGFTIAPLWVGVLLIAIMFIIGGRTLLENFGAGVLLQARAPFEPGEQVRLGTHVGLVQEVNSRVVVIDTIDNRRVFIPNVEVLREPIENITHFDQRMTSLHIDLIYGTDLDAAKSSILAAVQTVDQVLDDPAPAAEVRTFEESGVRFELRFWHASDVLAGWEATDAAARSVYARLADDGFTFAFPQRRLWWGAQSSDQPDPDRPAGF